MIKCALLLGSEKEKQTVYKCLEHLTEYKDYKIIYFIKSDFNDVINKSDNNIEVITLNKLSDIDVKKELKIIISSESSDDTNYHQLLQTGYSESNIIWAKDIIQKALDKEYEAFLHKYKFVEENLKITVNTSQIIEGLKESGFQVIELDVDKCDYNNYLEKANYEVKYPAYLKEFKENLPAKTFQHYLSYKLLDMKKDAVYMDVASRDRKSVV